MTFWTWYRRTRAWHRNVSTTFYMALVVALTCVVAEPNPRYWWLISTAIIVFNLGLLWVARLEWKHYNLRRENTRE